MDENFPHAQRPGDGTGVLAPGPSEAGQHVARGVVAPGLSRGRSGTVGGRPCSGAEGAEGRARLSTPPPTPPGAAFRASSGQPLVPSTLPPVCGSQSGGPLLKGAASAHLDHGHSQPPCAAPVRAPLEASKDGADKQPLPA